MTDNYHADMLRICIALAHDDWLRGHAQYMAQRDALLDPTIKTISDWERRAALDGDQAMLPLASALWVARRTVHHMWEYGRITAPEAHQLLYKYVHTLGYDQCCNTLLSEDDEECSDTCVAVDLLGTYIERVHAGAKP